MSTILNEEAEEALRTLQNFQFEEEPLLETLTTAAAQRTTSELAQEERARQRLVGRISSEMTSV